MWKRVVFYGALVSLISAALLRKSAFLSLRR